MEVNDLRRYQRIIYDVANTTKLSFSWVVRLGWVVLVPLWLQLVSYFPYENVNIGHCTDSSGLTMTSFAWGPETWKAAKSAGEQRSFCT